MNVIEYKNITELIRLYGSAQFWRGANPDNKEVYDRFGKDAEKYYNELLDILTNKL